MNIDEAKLLVSIFDDVLKVVDLREMRAIITSFAEGKEVQINIATEQEPKWVRSEVFQFDTYYKNYRIKPEVNVIEVKHEGKTFKLDLDKAKEFNLLKINKEVL